MTMKMNSQKALEEVVHVLDDIQKDVSHAADHSTELEEAVSHLHEAEIEVPQSLRDLAENLGQAAKDQDTGDDAEEAMFDNMPV